ncbi:hypothetical protein BP00DRAFT_133983 [Aspergillus indologenus CBS 114.80]|uniref:Uncharacterized protein n=1 Tax=Aspergillus indologenus CBS 114.80 TaxID=1450541 RepID=A0A2V5I867_9EURO|nr:hypothetical protein BP00DRAFT_133983 [Aspergillus indologenus CBS 114.80]
MVGDWSSPLNPSSTRTTFPGVPWRDHRASWGLSGLFPISLLGLQWSGCYDKAIRGTMRSTAKLILQCSDFRLQRSYCPPSERHSMLMIRKQNTLSYSVCERAANYLPSSKLVLRDYAPSISGGWVAGNMRLQQQRYKIYSTRCNEEQVPTELPQFATSIRAVSIIAAI